MSHEILLSGGADLTGLVISIGLPILLLAITLVIGSIGRSRHRARLVQRRAAVGDILLTDLKTFPGGVDISAPPTMVVAEAIYSADYFMSVVSGLKKIIGGSMGFYRDLAERTREEVTLRLLETARAAGYDAVCNLRIEWSDITGNAASSTGQKVATVSLLAVGTAYRRPRGA